MLDYTSEQKEKLFKNWQELITHQDSGLDEYGIGTGKEPFRHTDPDHQAGTKLFEPGQKILFLGCGTGDEVRWAKTQGYDAEGVTLGVGNFDTCKSKGLTVYHVDMHLLPLPDCTYDGIVSFQCLEHSPSHMLLFKEIYRLLKPGGYTYHQSPDAKTWTMGANKHHFFCIDELQAEGVLLKTGFVDVRCTRTGDGAQIEVIGRKKP